MIPADQSDALANTISHLLEDADVPRAVLDCCDDPHGVSFLVTIRPGTVPLTSSYRLAVQVLADLDARAP